MHHTLGASSFWSKRSRLIWGVSGLSFLLLIVVTAFSTPSQNPQELLSITDVIKAAFAKGFSAGKKETAHAHHEQHKNSVSKQSELSKYQAILSFPPLDADGDPVHTTDDRTRHPRRSVSAKKSREDINSFYDALQKQGVAVPTGQQAKRVAHALHR
eukprot:CAMPEP_0181327330 /NCGR_PEP_ID=MMETSP1101-20121128/22039_1 /TAXON_ID=46948 /ORGANISM="Rhodomonas abbreviata, Strain Caron Lab Isolate" /LENGTH=156 /DNA_ID=CAMNT_0023435973 /DNA_START=33 /DNA_END=500 /DNA_ORIENTATION=-